MKKTLFSAVFCFVVLTGVFAFDYDGVWIEHHMINMSVGTSRMYVIEPSSRYNDKIVAVESWNGKHDFSGTAIVKSDNRITIALENGKELDLDRFKFDSTWFDEEGNTYAVWCNDGDVYFKNNGDGQTNRVNDFVIESGAAIIIGDLKLRRTTSVIRREIGKKLLEKLNEW